MKKLIIFISSLFLFFSSSVLSITLWTTETQPGRMAIQEDLIKRFTAKTGIEVKLVPQEEDELIEKSSAAFAANSLPDIIFNAACVNFCAWAYDEGILDSDAATEIVNSLDKDIEAKLTKSLLPSKFKLFVLLNDSPPALITL